MENTIIFLIKNYSLSFAFLSFLVSGIVFFWHKFFHSTRPFFEVFLSYFILLNICICYIVNPGYAVDSTNSLN